MTQLNWSDMTAAASPVKPRAVIVDIDGTLALHAHRSPYDESRVITDEPHELVISNVRALAAQGLQIVITSGRTDACRADTETWLKQHLDVDYAALHMRAVGDSQHDGDLKEGFYREHIEPQYTVVLVLDDRDRVVDRWRTLGLLVYQVAFGDF
ncbi:hypothetical protein LO763_22440 [Glycomyces sp. A-F 0318]|uniref:phosphatase domain-containing protein n=1 Tax=Glycomyces amatae TaxID=2881355 RepID=UPI001E3FF610|nr:hypothetical protein [Glycomyces amatae]MCD0446378.1 hypothetical protein [Glycomyces amatae]